MTTLSTGQLSQWIFLKRYIREIGLIVVQYKERDSMYGLKGANFIW